MNVRNVGDAGGLNLGSTGLQRIVEERETEEGVEAL